MIVTIGILINFIMIIMIIYYYDIFWLLRL